MEDTLQKARAVGAKLLSQKQNGATVDQLRATSNTALLLLLKLREQNKNLCLETEQLREETAGDKLNLDTTSLVLQDLTYEKQYYEKDIQACRSFRSAVSDEQIGLMPLEDFLAQTQAENTSDEHQLMLQRLAHELSERKSLAKGLQDLEGVKENLQKELSEQRKMLDSLQDHLASIQGATKPLLDVLSPQINLRSLNRVADLLPLPLYIIYSQFAAAQEALALPVEVNITGDVAEAELLAAEVPGEQAGIGTPERAAKKLKVARDAELLAVHPLTVEVRVACPPESTVQLNFQHFSALNLIGVFPSNSADQQLLASLFPFDDGSPVLYEVVAQNHVALAASGKTKPYRWAQHLAGLDFISSLPGPLVPGVGGGGEVLEGLNMYREQERVSTFVSRVRSARTALAELKSTLASLSKKEAPDVSGMCQLLQPTRGECSIVSWQDITSSLKKARASEVNELTDVCLSGPGPSGAAPTTSQVGESRVRVAPVSIPGRGDPASSMLDAILIGLNEGEEEEKEEGAVEEEGEVAGSLQAMGDAASPLPGNSPVLVAPSPLNDDIDMTSPPGTADTGPLPYHMPDAEESKVVLKPNYKAYRLVLRSVTLECESQVYVFDEYGLRPPWFVVKGLVEINPKDRRSRRALDLPNEMGWLESQVNSAPSSIAPPLSPKVLAVQVVHLMQCFTELAAHYSAENQDKDLIKKLEAKQKQRGRERRPVIRQLTTASS